MFEANLDRFNFTELTPHSIWAKTNGISALPIEAISHQGEELSLQCFAVDNHELKTVKHLMPSMIAIDKEIVAKDCLCYLMERVRLPTSG